MNTDPAPVQGGFIPDAPGRDAAALVREALQAHGLARLRPMAEEAFLELAGRLGEIELRTDLVIDPARAEDEIRRRRLDGAAHRPVVYASTALEFHTDRPTVDVIGWYCVEQDARDGAFLLIDTADVAEHFSSVELDELEKIAMSYSVRDRETGREEIYQAPLLTRSSRGRRRLYYSPWQLAADLGGEPARLLARFAAYVSRKQETSLLRIRLERGESLFVDNHRLLHSRGDLSPDSRRHIVRLYIAGSQKAAP